VGYLAVHDATLPALGDALAAAVRVCPGAVLVRSDTAIGPAVLVQPCDAGLRPTGRCLRIGPVRCAADITAVGDWLRSGAEDPRALPAHLIAPVSRN
jgi:hypothetical protein